MDDSPTLNREPIASSYAHARIWGLQMVSLRDLFAVIGDAVRDAALFREWVAGTFLGVCFTRVPMGVL